MPLACLLEMDNCGLQTDNLEELEQKEWYNYRIFPMACNIQLVFYKIKGSHAEANDILVKALLNENETTLPLPKVSGPYYRWTDFRDYYLQKLNNYRE
jgi:hypothetical protein